MSRTGIDLGHGEPGWIVTKERSKWDAIFQVDQNLSSLSLGHFQLLFSATFKLLFLTTYLFQSLGPHKGKITGSTAKKEMVKSRLPNPVLAKIWRLADVDQVSHNLFLHDVQIYYTNMLLSRTDNWMLTSLPCPCT